MRTKKTTTQSWVRSGLVAALDIGTTKVCCFIARRTGGEGVRLAGIGYQASRGLRGGTLVDLDAAEATIRATVESAERMTGENVRHVWVNVSAGAPRSRMVVHEMSVAGHEIGESDLRRVVDLAAVSAAVSPDHEIVHAVPVSYSIDGCRGVRDPRGMYGQRLGVNLHVVSAASGALRNLATCVARCHLDIADKVVSAYASALGCLVEDETALGVTLIDMGGGTTSVAVFFDGELVHVDSLPVGGIHVTNDIARGLSTPLIHAERMKTLFGSALPSPSDDRQLIEVPPIADDGAAEVGQVPRSMLVSIIRPRVEEIFEMVRARLEDAGFDKIGGRRLVLTGGASQLPGAPELAGMILDKQVRVSRPRSIEGLPEAAAGPAFSTCAGLLHYAVNQPMEMLYHTYRPVEDSPNWLSRFGQWLREYF